mmetsp:Transcript_2367/g.6355  ORF Transcript_2367/g.6355 Transcript_2367/m.6355 type:complete len:223 (-) Transcript_2367:705-1373(-)
MYMTFDAIGLEFSRHVQKAGNRDDDDANFYNGGDSSSLRASSRSRSSARLLVRSSSIRCRFGRIRRPLLSQSSSSRRRRQRRDRPVNGAVRALIKTVPIVGDALDDAGAVRGDPRSLGLREAFALEGDHDPGLRRQLPEQAAVGKPRGTIRAPVRFRLAADAAPAHGLGEAVVGPAIHHGNDPVLQVEFPAAELGIQRGGGAGAALLLIRRSVHERVLVIVE